MFQCRSSDSIGSVSVVTPHEISVARVEIRAQEQSVSDTERRCAVCTSEGEARVK